MSVVDMLGVVRNWGNTLSGVGGLVGAGNPLALGFHERRLRSPERGVYALVEMIEDPDAGLTAEGSILASRFTFSVYSATDSKAARLAGIALINALRSINSTPVSVDGVRLVMVAEVVGESTDEANASTNASDEPLYLVRGVIHAAPN